MPIKSMNQARWGLVAAYAVVAVFTVFTRESSGIAGTMYGVPLALSAIFIVPMMFSHETLYFGLGAQMYVALWKISNHVWCVKCWTLFALWYLAWVLSLLVICKIKCFSFWRLAFYTTLPVWGIMVAYLGFTAR